MACYGVNITLLTLLCSLVVSKTPTSVRYYIVVRWHVYERWTTALIHVVSRSQVSPCGICGGQSGNGTSLLQVLRFSSVKNILPVLYTQLHLHLDVVLTWRAEGRSLGTIQSEMLFRKSLSIVQKPTFTFYFVFLRLARNDIKVGIKQVWNSLGRTRGLLPNVPIFRIQWIYTRCILNHPSELNPK